MVQPKGKAADQLRPAFLEVPVRVTAKMTLEKARETEKKTPKTEEPVPRSVRYTRLDRDIPI